MARHKNYFPTLVIIILLWSAIIGLIFFVDPESMGAIPIFFGLVFLCLTFTLATLLANTKRGLIASTALTTFLILKSFGLGNILNLFLITGVAITAELYFNRLNQNDQIKKQSKRVPKKRIRKSPHPKFFRP